MTTKPTALSASGAETRREPQEVREQIDKAFQTWRWGREYVAAPIDAFNAGYRAALAGESPAAPTPEGLQEWADWFDRERPLYVTIENLPNDRRLPAHGLLRTIAREFSLSNEEGGQ